MFMIMAKYICLISSPIGWSILSILFFTFSEQKQRYIRLIFLVFFGMVLNAFFKNIFKIALPAHLVSDWYAFPSGHLQAAVIFLGWLAIEYKQRWLYIAAPCFVAINGWAIWMMGFHHAIDLWGGLASGSIILFCYALLCANVVEKKQVYFGFIFGTCGTLMLLSIPRSFTDHWGCIGILFGLWLGTILNKQKKIKINLFTKSFITFVQLGAFAYILNALKPLMSIQCFWFNLGFWSFLLLSYGIEKQLNFLEQKSK